MPPAKKAPEAETAMPEGFVKPTGCAAKLAFVQSHIPEIKKTGRNTHQGFDYMQEHGILAALRPYQRELGFAVVTTFSDYQRAGNLSSVTVTVEMIDVDAEPGDPHAVISASYPMEATDNQGWGAAKALTYGKKFALQKFFGIPTEELPEAEAEGIPVQGPAPSLVPSEHLPDAAQVKALRAEATAAAKSRKGFGQRFKAYLQATFQADSPEDLKLAAHVAQAREWVAEQSAGSEAA